LSLLVGALRGIDMPQEARRLIAQMEVSTNAMDGLFTALLDISRLDAGVVEVHRRRFRIGSLIERILPRLCRGDNEERHLVGLETLLLCG
jgi:two-component system, sensor histidine kinase